MCLDAVLHTTSLHRQRQLREHIDQAVINQNFGQKAELEHELSVEASSGRGLPGERRRLILYYKRLILKDVVDWQDNCARLGGKCTEIPGHKEGEKRLTEDDRSAVLFVPYDSTPIVTAVSRQQPIVSSVPSVSLPVQPQFKPQPLQQQQLNTQVSQPSVQPKPLPPPKPKVVVISISAPSIALVQGTRVVKNPSNGVTMQNHVSAPTTNTTATILHEAIVPQKSQESSLSSSAPVQSTRVVGNPSSGVTVQNHVSAPTTNTTATILHEAIVPQKSQESNPPSAPVQSTRVVGNPSSGVTVQNHVSAPTTNTTATILHEAIVPQKSQESSLSSSASLVPPYSPSSSSSGSSSSSSAPDSSSVVQQQDDERSDSGSDAEDPLDDIDDGAVDGEDD